MLTHESQMLEVIAAFEAGDWGLGLSIMTMLKKTLSQRNDETRLREARDAIERDYHDTVKGVVNEIADDWKAGSYAGSRDSLMQAIEESCDARCTYTTDCQYYLVASQNESAYIEEFGSLPDDKDDIPWAALASCAMRRDVIEDLERFHDIDVNKDPPDEAVINCSSCDEWKPGRDALCDDCRGEEDDDEEDEDPEEDCELGGPAPDGPCGDADG